VRAVSATNTFFRTLGISLLHGSLFAETGAGNPLDVVISASLAKRLFGTTNAVGHTIGGQRRIVGVVRDVLWQANPSANIAGIVYRPLGSPGYFGFVYVTARFRGSAPAAIAAIKRTIKQAVPGSAVYQTHTMENRVRNGLALRAVAAGLIGSFAVL